jgi:hypothetical protein
MGANAGVRSRARLLGQRRGAAIRVEPFRRRERQSAVRARLHSVEHRTHFATGWLQRAAVPVGVRASQLVRRRRDAEHGTVERNSVAIDPGNHSSATTDHSQFGAGRSLT